jgi:hypothetical protein
VSQVVVLAGIVFATFALHVLSPVTTSTDSAWSFHVAASILRQGDVNLDEYRHLMDLQLDYRLRVVQGHIYYYYPVATPLLVAPAVWLINEIYPLFHTTDFYAYLSQHGPDSRTARLEKLLASGIVALATAVMFLVARLRVRVAQSSLIAVIFAFSTSMWSTASRALWQHGPSALFLALALYLLLSAPDRPLTIFCAGLILGCAYVIRPTNSLSLGILGLFILNNHRSRFGLYAAGAAMALIPFFVQNWLAYGNLFPPYSYQLFERLGTPSAVAGAMAGTLVSPSRGLFVFTPVLLFAVYGAWVSARKVPWSLANLDLYLIGILVAHWITTSLFEDWGGAWSIGPRYFVDILPYLAYFLIPLLEGSIVTSFTARCAFAAAIAASALVQWHCATSIDPFMWNGKPKALVEAPERKWDWGDLQFLRGTCQDNPREGRAPACWFQNSR